MDADLDRYVTAQRPFIDEALEELRAGRKTSHWMWFIFPQLAGLGRSETARRYAIGSLEEARAYRTHEVLGPRLLACMDALLSTSGRTATDILGSVDAMKLRSSMTLFEAADPGEPRFAAVLDRFFGGERDPRTRSLLGADDPGAAR